MYEIDFGEDHLNKAEPSFMWGDNPFVVSVLCEKTPNGYLTDWWVTGRRYSKDVPRLLLRLRMSLPESTKGLREDLLNKWNLHLVDLAFESAEEGGIENPSPGLKELSPNKQQELFQFHLTGHDQFHHFNNFGNSKVEKTANMYLLLKSLGSTRSQQAIAKFESFPFIHEVAVTAINQRLANAKKKGFIPPKSSLEKHPNALDERDMRLQRRHNDQNDGGD